jgi:hypothetical protein
VLRWSDDWHVPGRLRRSASLVAAIVSGALAAVLALAVAGPWRAESTDHAHFPREHVHSDR